jgi:NADH-quinone oxidoreductase subunit N
VYLSKVILDLQESTRDSLWAFKPELWLCGAIVAILFARLFGVHRVLSPFAITLVATIGALVQQGFMIQQFNDNLAAYWGGRMEFFDGLLIYDNVTVFFRMFLLAFAALLAILMQITRVPDRDAASDVYPLVLGSTLGMCLMASANHLLIVFLAVEMASVPSYALAGMLKGRRVSSEGALKYAVYGAGTAGIMLYGISLLGGYLGTVHMPTMALRLSELDWTQLPSGELKTQALGGLMLMLGLSYKLSAVPFHFRCPDVVAGAAAELTAFLSGASKAAALALLVRVGLGLGHLPEHHAAPIALQTPVAVQTPAAASPVSTTASAVAYPLPGGRIEAIQSVPGSVTFDFDIIANADDGLSPVRTFASYLIAFVAVITCTFGNLAAYGQTNIKRMLAYSTIAHAGYMMMSIGVAIDLLNPADAHPQAISAIGSLLVYTVTYLFMNLGAFAIVAFLRNRLHSEQIADYAGLIRTSPTLVICMVIVLLSLVGLPPLAGFFGKFVVFAAVADGYTALGSPLWLTVLVVGALNTAVSLFYYLRVIKVMCIDPESESRAPARRGASWFENIYALGMAIPVIVIGLLFSYLVTVAQAAVRQML